MGCWSGTVGMLELNYFREHFLFAKGEILHVRHIFFGKINKFLRKNVHEKKHPKLTLVPGSGRITYTVYFVYIEQAPQEQQP